MAPLKKTILLSLILVSSSPILGMLRRIRQPAHLLVKASRQPFHFHSYPNNTNPDIKELSGEELEQFLRNNHLSPKNLPFALATIGKVTSEQIEALNEFKQRQLNRKWHKKDKESE